MRSQDLDMYLHHLYKIALQSPDWETTESFREYSYLASYLNKANPKNNIFQDHTVASLSSDESPVGKLNPVIIYKYIIQFVKPLFKVNSTQLNATFCDIVASDFCRNRSGFTGTTYFSAPFDRIKQKTLAPLPVNDSSAAAAIQNSVINRRTQIVPINGFLESLDRYKALIDVTGYFAGQSNESVAQKILDTVTGIHMVIYYNPQDEQTKLSSTADAIITPENTFVYFDQKHTVGADVKEISPNAVGLVLIDFNTTLRQYSQGAVRLRQINKTQFVDIAIDESLQLLIQDKMNKNKIIFDKLVFNNNEWIKSKNKLQALQNLRTICRNTAIASKALNLVQHPVMSNNIYSILSNMPLPQLANTLKELVNNFQQNLVSKHKNNIILGLQILKRNDLLLDNLQEISSI